MIPANACPRCTATAEEPGKLCRFCSTASQLPRSYCRGQCGTEVPQEGLTCIACMNMRPKPEMFPCPGGCGTNGYTRALCVACKDAVAIDDARDFMGHVSRVDRHFAVQSERLEKFIMEQTKDLFVHLTTALAVPPAAPARENLSNKALYAIRVLLLQSIDEAKERMWQDKQEELERTLAEFDAWRKEQ